MSEPVCVKCEMRKGDLSGWCLVALGALLGAIAVLWLLIEFDASPRALGDAHRAEKLRLLAEWRADLVRAGHAEWVIADTNGAVEWRLKEMR